MPNTQPHNPTVLYLNVAPHLRSVQYADDGMVCSHFNSTEMIDQNQLTDVDCAALSHCFGLTIMQLHKTASA